MQEKKWWRGKILREITAKISRLKKDILPIGKRT